MKYLLSALLILFLFWQVYSQDTFSITAIDTITGEVGSAGASCIDENAIAGGCIILSDVKPGIGVIHTQAYWNPTNQNYASSLMDLGLHPEQIIDSLVAHDVQNNPHIRQYGIIDFYEGSVRNAAYTGVNCDDYKNHIIGPNYTIQGNILLGQEILDSMETRFLASEGELACKLMEALQGAKVIGADTRCFDDGTSSLSAFLRVGKPGDPPDQLYLDLNVPSTPDGIDPIDELQAMVDDWGGCYISATGNGNKINRVKVFPNPAKNEITFKVSHTLKRETELIIYNYNGSAVFNKAFHHQNLLIIKPELKPGLYFYELKDSQTTLEKGKLMIN